MTVRTIRMAGFGCAVLLAGVLAWVDLNIAGRDLAPQVGDLLAAALHVDPAQVRVGRAAIHPLGHVRLSDAELKLPGGAVLIQDAVLHIDPLEALRGRMRLSRLDASEIAVQRGNLWARAGRARLLPRGGKRARLQAHEVLVGGLPIPGPGAQVAQLAHVALDLEGTHPSRIAASGVRWAGLGPGDLLLLRGDDGEIFRAATDGGMAAGLRQGQEATLDLSLDRLALRLPLSPSLDLSGTRASGGLRIGLRPPPGVPFAQALLRKEGTLEIAGRIAVLDLSLKNPLLAAGTLPNLGLILEGELTGSRIDGGLLLHTPGLVLRSGGARMRVIGEVEIAPGAPQNGHYRADVEVAVEEADCWRLWQALPRALAPKLEGLGVQGTLGGELRLAFDSRALPDLDLQTDLSIGCRVTSDPPRADARALLSPRLSIERPGEDGRPRQLPLGPEAPGAQGEPGFQPLYGLPWPVVRMFLVAEDNQFYNHHGFDAQMIARALGTNLLERQTIKGASTVTQQLAKNLWLGQERALGRKLAEAVLAWRMEQVASKDRILEVYLNLVELGSGIHGIAMASQHYFAQPPSRLTLEQAAQLAALLPAPRRGMDAAWSRRYRDLLRRYNTAHVPHPKAKDR
jgi:hypothetical protein